MFNYPCGENTVCVDQERGYDCVCLPGFDNIDGDNACEGMNWKFIH